MQQLRFVQPWLTSRHTPGRTETDRLTSLYEKLSQLSQKYSNIIKAQSKHEMYAIADNVKLSNAIKQSITQQCRAHALEVVENPNKCKNPRAAGLRHNVLQKCYSALNSARRRSNWIQQVS